ncbi:hypothetical protein GCM10020254_29900 [Streptomyces goshikiensis]
MDEPDADLLVVLEAARPARDLVVRGAEVLELGPDRVVDRHRGEDMAFQPQFAAHQGERVPVDAAGAVHEGLARADHAAGQQVLDRRVDRRHLHDLEPQDVDSVAQVYQIRFRHLLGE